MAYAVTHVLGTIIAVDIYRDYFAKKKFSLFYVYLAGFFGLVPDIDIPLGMILGKNLHGTFTHWIYWPMLAFFVSFVLFKCYNHKTGINKKSLIKTNTRKTRLKHEKLKKYGMIALFIGIGLMAHMFNTCPTAMSNYAVHADAIILVAWLIWEWRKHNIKDFV